MTIYDRQSRRELHAGFTLIEMLTVIVIIVMLIGLAALAFNTLTGRRSASMAQNQIAAMLGQMRAMAMNDASTDPNLYGVLFFYDPNAERTVMQPVVLGNVGDPDPNDQYKGWVKDRNNLYQVGDRVVAITGVVMSSSGPTQPRPMPVRFRCIQVPNSTSNTAQFPPAEINFFTGVLANLFWELDMSVAALDISDVPAEQLPAGIGVQLLTDVTDPTTTLGATGSPERYLQTGMILFDKTGKVAHVKYVASSSISGYSDPIQRRLQAQSVVSYVAIYSQFGLNIFDREKFIAATQTAALNNFTASDQDYTFQVFGGARPAANDELNEEQWLDENGKLLVLDRTSSELKEVRK